MKFDKFTLKAQEAIEQAVSDFRTLVSGKLKCDDRIILTIRQSTGKADINDLKHVAHELCNYVLGLMKNKGMV